jgi:hypothetical protein
LLERTLVASRLYQMADIQDQEDSKVVGLHEHLAHPDHYAIKTPGSSEVAREHDIDMVRVEKVYRFVLATLIKKERF